MASSLVIHEQDMTCLAASRGGPLKFEEGWKRRAKPEAT